VVETNYYSLKMQVEARVADVQAYILSRRATGWELVLDTLGRIFRRAVTYIASSSLLRISGF
jgi:hypothetical protein